MIDRLPERFIYGLKQLDMYVPDQPESSGLVFIDETPENPYELLALEKARKYKVDAVYFRRFEERKASIPQVYIYDYTSAEPDENKIGELHLKLWNAGHVPLFFIFIRTEIRIFNCLKRPDFDEEGDKFIASPMETISLAAAIDTEMERKKRQEFSAALFDNGSFWDTSTYRVKFNSSVSSYETLLKKLKDIRKKIIGNKILSKPIADKLLVMSILLKYLEERTDEAGNRVFPPGFFNKYAPGANDFIDVLKKKGACLDLFDYLGRHFNGEIFKWDDEKERKKLSGTDLSRFAEFFEGRTEVEFGQRTLWRLYSFNDLPIELISNFYEEFLGDEEGVVYTPPYLVHFLVDEAMPLESPRDNFKIIDPACGSGVFLVAAYQRIIDWWRSRHDWQKPALKTLKQLLKDSIYGIDISAEAVRLTIFSLSLVLLDELKPREIWENLKFDNLKREGNLFEKDFFELIHKQEIDKKFDLVIGNSPFIAKIETPAAKNIESNQIEKRGKLPDNQLALLFLEQAMTICKNSGLLCLIMPSGPFLYNYGGKKFRWYFLQNYHVIQLLDLTFLQGILFKSAKVATAVVFARNEKPDSNEILHVTLRRTKAAKEKIYLELDRCEEHRVSYRDAMNSPLVWKANLLGGGRLFHLISRLDALRKFGAYIKEKIKHNGWAIGEGFQTSSETKRLEELERRKSAGETLSPDEKADLQRLKNKLKKTDHLTGKNYLPTDALTENGIDESQIHILTLKYFHRNRGKNKSIFKGPHILIKEGAARESIPIAFLDDDLSFMDSIIGIHAPEQEREELLGIERRIKGNRDYLFFAAAFSRKHLIRKGTAILKKDIENLPYPEDESEMELSEIEQVLVDDVLDYMMNFYQKGEKSKVFHSVTGDQLAVFGETYCKILNTVYDRFVPQKPIHIHHFVCYPICYGDCPELETGDAQRYEQNIEQLVYRKIGKALRITRMIRIYDQNVIYLVKPRLLKYWLRSIAVRDADDTFADLVKQGF